MLIKNSFDIIGWKTQINNIPINDFKVWKKKLKEKITIDIYILKFYSTKKYIHL